MDFSKIKKIFYIVSIISILLSLKSRVFGASFDYVYDNTNYSLLLPDFIDEHNLNYFVDFFYGSVNVGFELLVTGSDELNVTGNYDTRYFFGDQQFVLYYYRMSTKDFNKQGMNSLINNASNYFNNLTYSKDYENQQGFYGNNNYIGFQRPDSVDIKSYLSTININQNNNTIFPSNSFSPPFFDNLTEIKKGYPDGVFVSLGDYSDSDALYFHLLKITNTVPDGNQSTYYYESKVFKLTKDSKYFRTYDADTETKYSYYFIERSSLTLDTNSSYLYVLSNSGDSITNSYGILQPDISGGIYDVVQSDTAGVITEQQALNDKIANMNNNQQEFQQQQQEFQNQNSISPETETNIDTNLNFNNNAPNFSNMYGSFFSRLSSTISNLGSYDLSNVDTFNLPIPFTENSISLSSNMVSQHMPDILVSLFTTFWLFIFGKYFLSYILYIYRLIASGHILDNISSNNEIITNDML